MPDWSPRAPHRLAFASTESGVWQLNVLDLATGMRRRVTDHPVGVTDGSLTLDGTGVLWFQDETGDESGQWLVQPFEGGGARPFLEGIPRGWNEGLAQAPGIVAVALSDRDGFAVYMAANGAPAKELLRSTESLRLGGTDRGGFNRGGLSTDGTLLCLEHSEHGDLIHPALRVIDARTASTIGELRDEGMSLTAWCWSPVAGDQRLAIVHEREEHDRPAIWNLTTGERQDLHLNLEGLIEVHDWWPDGSALLLVNLHEGRDRLLRFDMRNGDITEIRKAGGAIPGALVRPDGKVWCRHASSGRQPLILDERENEVVVAQGERAPGGRPYTTWHFENPSGQRVHGFYVTPEGPGPHPVVMRVHGGPTSFDADAWQPEVQAYVDAGFAVGMVNYRGSAGYGREWRDVIIGDIGRPELEDVNAGLADLIARGIADPKRAVVLGWSWGGYTTVMELGKHPELWACGIAGIPVGDYEAGYEELSPLLQAYDRALLGGAPADVPELMRDRNPIHFADDVRAPVLFIIGENDSRCPFRQAMLYVDRLKARGHPHEVYTFSTGHGSFDVHEEVRQQRVILDFLDRHVPKG
jgi:dipeptidyl aminopeptidase/acylaminoacyl peptidase